MTDVRTEALRLMRRSLGDVFPEAEVERLAGLYGEGAEKRRIGNLILETLARAAITGDIKSAQLLMELAGQDVKSREYAEKRRLESEKLMRGTAAPPVLLDASYENDEDR